MNRSIQTSGYGIRILWLLIVFFVVSYGSAGRQPERITKAASLSSGTLPITYGASLSEWEATAQANTGQTANSNHGHNGRTHADLPLIPVASLARSATTESDIGSSFTLDNVVYREMLWDGLIPADFTAEAIMSKYEDQLAELEDGSPEASNLYQMMQGEFSSAPVNEVLNETLVRLPGFIAPLNYTGDLITEFLLVPYFGACIHTPPPPANQTVLVQVAEGQGIKPEDSDNPIWVMGKLTTETTTTQLAAAGYNIQEAIFEPYTNP